MLVWFWPELLTEEKKALCIRENMLALAAGDMPDLKKLQGQDQLASGLRRMYPELTPEAITVRSEQLWRLGAAIESDDFIVVGLQPGTAFMIGEVTGGYFYTTMQETAFHCLPMQWLVTDVPLEKCPALDAYLDRLLLEEVTEPALQQVKNYIPSLKRSGHLAFKWISVIILIFELAYFWPH